MKLTTAILLTALAASSVFAQNPTIIQSTRNSLNTAAKKAETEQNAALQAAGVPSKPAAGTTAKPSAAAVNAKASTVQVKPVAPAVKSASNPAKPVSVANKQVAAQSTSTSAQTKQGSKVAPASGQVASSPAKKTAPIKIAVSPVKAQPKQGAQKVTPATPKTPKSAQHEADKAAKAAAAAPAKSAPATAASSAEPVKETKTITAEGRRDPFLSPVVSRSNGPNCSTGKRCLAIDQIVVRGVVKSDGGMIAVVVNSINKAYFLKENDPVYNGYVLSITGDSVVFKETFQDRLGKESTREVVKKITTPAV
jgi:hypothetical protein